MICIGAVVRRTLWAVTVAVLAWVASACGGGTPDADGPTATVPKQTTTTNPYAVPEVIDDVYVNRVLARADQETGDINRIVIAAGSITQEAMDRLEDWFKGDALLLKLKGYQRDILTGFAGYRPNPGNKRSTISNLITATSSCIFAEVVRDFSAVGANPDPAPARQWVALKLADRAANTSQYNPTPWIITYDGFQGDLSQPPDPCLAG